MNLANYITVMRLFAIPLFLVLVTSSPAKYSAALIVFILAAVSDAVDGIVARSTGNITKFGRFIDPMADKLLLTSSFVALSATGIIPLWVTVVVVARDIIIFLGWIGIYILTGISIIKPSIVSKITTFFQMMTIILGLLQIDYSYMKYLYVLTVGFTCISGIHYIIRTVYRYEDKAE